MPQQEHENIQGNSSPDPSSVITSFDELAKGLATGAVSRGKALRWMGGALVGAALASIPGVAWAAPCPEGQTRCGDRCVNLQTNERHCGSCRNRCRSTQTCCGGRCVNLQTNERHCGSCFNRCAGEGEEGDECVAGVCQGGGGCPSGTTLCGGVCVSNVCPQGQFFNTSACECQCVQGTTACGGNCVANCPSGQPLNCSTCQCEVGVCPSGSSVSFDTGLCGGECVYNYCSSGTHFDCSNCLCVGGPCPSGSALSRYPDFGYTCCPIANICGAGEFAECCSSNATCCGTGRSARCCSLNRTCVNGICQTA